MTKEQVVKEYFKMAEKIREEKQFSRKVDLNTKIHQFRKDNNLTMETNNPITKLFVDDEHIATIFKRYSSRKVNLEYKELKKRLLVMKGE